MVIIFHPEISNLSIDQSSHPFSIKDEVFFSFYTATLGYFSYHFAPKKWSFQASILQNMAIIKNNKNVFIHFLKNPVPT